MPEAGNQPEVLWQEPQDAWVWMCVDGFPAVVEPLWQLPQALGAMPLWSNLAPVKVTAEWQLSQPNGVAKWVAGLTILDRDRRLPWVWQVAHSLGVPLNTPDTWHDSQRALACMPA